MKGYYFDQRLYRLIVPYAVIQVRPAAVTNPKINVPKFGVNVVLTVSRFTICIQDWAIEKNKSGIRYENNAHTTTQTAMTVAAAFAKTFAFNIIITSFLILMFMTFHHKNHHYWANKKNCERQNCRKTIAPKNKHYCQCNRSSRPDLPHCQILFHNYHLLIF